MKKLLYLLILIPLCFALSSDAKMNFYQAASVGGGVGCSKGSTLNSQDFEGISDTEEWATDGWWTESNASTNNFVGDDAIPHAGTLAGLVDNLANGNFIHRAITEITTGYTTFDFWINSDVVNATITDVFNVSDGAIGTAGNKRVRLQISSSGTLQIMDNAGYVDMASISADTWTHIEVEVNTDAGVAGADAIRVWINGIEGTNSPYTTSGATNPSGIDRFGHATDSSGDYWIDDVLHYAGQRCEN